MERDLKVVRAENVRLEVEVRREREEKERAERDKERVKQGMEKKLIRAEEAKVSDSASLHLDSLDRGKTCMTLAALGPVSCLYQRHQGS